jgi:P4 family phage/plasmid primase-like protien
MDYQPDDEFYPTAGYDHSDSSEDDTLGPSSKSRGRLHGELLAMNMSADEAKNLLADVRSASTKKSIADLLLSKENGLAKFFYDLNKNKIIIHNDDFYMLDDKTKIWLRSQDCEVGLSMCSFLSPIIEEHRNEWNAPEKNKDKKNPFAVVIDNFINKHIGTMSMVKKLKPLVLQSQKSQKVQDFIFNQDYHYLIPIRNGKVVNLQTGDLEDGKPEFKFDFFLDLEIETDMQKIKFINQVMLNICCGDKKLFRYLQVMLGYMITGETKEQSAFIWYGSGRNGKSTIISLLKKVLGKFYGELPEHLIINKESSRFKDSNSVSPAEIKLKDSRVAILTETKKAEEINDKVIKRITGGEVMEGRGLFQDITYFQPKFKPVVCSNFKPKVDVQDYALMRRLVLFPFNAKFVENPILPNEYTVDKDLTTKLEKDYLNAFFTWLCMGAKKYYQSGLPEQTQLMKDEMDTFVQDNKSEDDIQDWLEQFCDTSNSNYETKGTELFQSYRNWYVLSHPDRNHKKDKEFYNILRQKNLQTKTKHHSTWFTCIKLKD